MAIPIQSALGSVGFIRRTACACSFSKISSQFRNKASWTKFFKKEDGESEGTSPPLPRSIGPDDGPSTTSRLDSLRKREGLVTVRGYSPPDGVAERISAIAHSVTGQAVDHHVPLNDRSVKFQLLTRLMSEFDHYIPNTELNNLHTLDDIITFFSTPVKDRSSYEDLAKLDLPPNLHIQMEPVRFEAETDKFFDGQSAFPGSPTVVSSLKYRRKYKGNEGESRNQPSRTRFEEIAMYARKTKV